MSDEQKTSTEGSRKGTAIGATIFALVLIIAVIAYNALTSGDMEDINLQPTEPTTSNTASATGSSSSSSASQKVPDISLANAEGETVSLSSFEGEPTVLNFWASTCGPCQSEMPHFQAAYEAYGDRVNFVMVDIPGFNGETTARATRFLEDNGYTFPVYFDLEGEASRAFNLTSIPRTYFIDADGSLVTMGNGALSASALQQGLQALGIS